MNDTPKTTSIDTITDEFEDRDTKLYSGTNQDKYEFGNINSENQSTIVDDEAQIVLGKHLSHVKTMPLSKKEKILTMLKIDIRITMPKALTI